MNKNTYIIINDKPEMSELHYSKSKVEAFINHLLSKQKHFTGGSYLSVSDVVEECKKFGFNVMSEGKSIDE